MNYPKAFIAFSLIVTLLFLSGCVKRNLHIQSDPPGATVYFNEREIGTTPLDYDFMHHAKH